MGAGQSIRVLPSDGSDRALSRGPRTPTTHIEDAVHLYALFEESPIFARLEEWTTRLGVEDEYERLERA
jgi:hypothetical protein